MALLRRIEVWYELIIIPFLNPPIRLVSLTHSSNLGSDFLRLWLG